MSTENSQQPSGALALYTTLDSFESRIWWSAVLRGVLAFILGVVVIVWARESLELGARIIGCFAIANGVIGVGCAIADRNNPRGRGWPIAMGIISLLVGIIVVGWPKTVVQIVTVAAGVLLVIFGIVFLVTGLRAKSRPNTGFTRGTGMVITGIVTTVLGLVVAFAPLFVASVMVAILGIGLALVGVLLIAIGFSIRSSLRRAVVVQQPMQ